MSTTRPSFCSPTATSVPALFMEKWRGKRPPAGTSWIASRAPVAASMAKLMRGSEGIAVLLPASKLGTLRLFSLREETTAKFWSGWAASVRVLAGPWPGHSPR